MVAETDQQVIDTLRKIVDGKTGNSDLVDAMVVKDMCQTLSQEAVLNYLSQV